MGESTARLTAEFDGRPAVVSLDELTKAADKGDKAVGNLGKSAQTTAEKLRATAEAAREFVRGSAEQLKYLEKERAELDRIGLSSEKVKGYIKDLNAETLRQASVADQAEKALAKLNATIGNEASPASLAGASTRAAGGLRGLGRPLTSLLTQIDGLPPIVGRLGYALSSFAVGGPIAIGVVAGLAAIGGAYYLLTQDARRAQKQIDEAADSVKKLRFSVISEPLKLQLDITGALAKLGQLDGRLSLTRRIANGFNLQNTGSLALDLTGRVVQGVTGLVGDNAQQQRDEIASGAAAGRYQQQQQYFDSLRDLASKNKLTAAQQVELQAEIKNQLGIARTASDELRSMSRGNPLRASYASQFAGAIGRADALQDALDRPGEEAAKEADAARKAGQRLADQAYAQLVRGVEERISEDKIQEGGKFGSFNRVRLTRDTGYDDAFLQLARARREAQIAKDAGLGNLRGAEFATGGAIGGIDVANADGTRGRQSVFGQFSKGLELRFGGTSEQLARLEGFQKLRTNLADALGKTLEGGITAGFETFFRTGSIGDGFKALAGGLLNGLGDAAISFGVGAIALSKLMISIKKSIQHLNPEIALPAGIALVALGGTLKGLASKLFSGGGGGGTSGAGGGYGGGGYTGAPDIIDRGVIAGALPSASIPSAASVGALGTPTQPVVVNANIIGTADPRAQRDITDLIRGAVSRGLTAPGFSPATA